MNKAEFKKENKSDKNAIKNFKRFLLNQNYHILNEHHPVDIIAEKNGETFYFELKKTSKQKSIFGAATFTEWECAFTYPDNFFFVIAVEIDIQNFEFYFLTPEEFMQYSTIPPIKVYFTIGDIKKIKQPIKSKDNLKSLPMNKNVFLALNQAYQTCKKMLKNKIKL